MIVNRENPTDFVLSQNVKDRRKRPADGSCLLN